MHGAISVRKPGFVFLLLFLIPCANANNAAVVASFDPPVFWTCANPPPPPAGTAQSALSLLGLTQLLCGQNEISGSYIGMGFANAQGFVPAARSVVQLVNIAGIAGRTTARSSKCGDDLVPFAFSYLEYYSTPANNVDVTAVCCEQTLTLTAKNMVDMQVMTPQLNPDAYDPVAPGENASRITKSSKVYKHHRDAIVKWASLFWGYTQEYDGCEPNAPQTSCGKTHCLNRWQRDREWQFPDKFTLKPVRRESFQHPPQ